ncbi:hypothetical protein ACIO6U_02490 [Streptomyces sp. NPDC087422]|uniref:hypothetical protein n=1 Tax=Streptomyces sp. NPDC087422 TaxID=3365786 RepID=UPI00382FA519
MPELTRVEIDPNVRVTAPDGTVNATRAVLGDANGLMRPGDHVVAFESESRLEWPARVVAVRGEFVWLHPQWSEYRVYAEV